jgi:GLPGLI family protein
MKRCYSFICLLLLLNCSLFSQQRVVAECTINFSVEPDSTNNNESFELLKNTSKTVYIKGNDCRTEFKNQNYNQTLLYDKETGNAVILREFGNNKIMTKLNKTQYETVNAKYFGATFTTLPETKTILGYICQKGILKTKDAESIVYYATSIVPSVKEFEYQFKDVPGFVLCYEVEDKGKSVKYIATKINLSPVQASKFDVPTSGFRIKDL